MGNVAQRGNDGQRGLLVRTYQRFAAHNMSDWAAALTYYAVLSIFPGMLVLVSTVGMLSPQAVTRLVTILGQVVPGAAQQILTDGITQLTAAPGTAGVLAIAGLAGGLWAASGYVAAFMRASNVVYCVPEGRPIWKLLPVRLIITIVVGTLTAAAGLMVVFTGQVAQFAGELIGAGGAAVTIWDVVKWPALVMMIAVIFTVLYWVCPNAQVGGFSGLVLGGAIAVLVWLVASAGFGFYVANFASYNATYGALGGIIIFLIWLWLSNMVILFGAELNAERLRGRLAEEAEGPARVPLRDERALSREQRDWNRHDRQDVAAAEQD